MKLSVLIDALPEKTLTKDTDPDITGIVQDSRQVRPGALFVAVAGASVDGHRYIGDAIDRGAAAVVGEKNLPQLPGLPYVRVPDGRAALAVLCAAWHGFPARRL